MEAWLVDKYVRPNIWIVVGLILALLLELGISSFFQYKILSTHLFQALESSSSLIIEFRGGRRRRSFG
ncbi:hypothetical protein RchiOBHm_Chr4g0407771 [Rosa chinensis]|uniref:Uncharacterized protein n=1 Tax=Rosa chinensis TaxID=74649 RepID=A0A2P6QUS3_ROSCH|nr:hypothetical protein RchiOBHm_Chr4g0407771 [Rosa chinensis]